MIPQYQQLLPLETNVSGTSLSTTQTWKTLNINNRFSSNLNTLIHFEIVGTWQNTSFPKEKSLTANKSASPPISVTPSSICTDASDIEYQPQDLSRSRKYSISTPPLSNVKSESIDYSDGNSPKVKQESIMLVSNVDKFTDGHESKLVKKSSNFTIEHLLSSAFRPATTYHYLLMPKISLPSIFTKRKMKHLSENGLHQIIDRREKHRTETCSFDRSRHSMSTRGMFVSFIFDLVKDFINQHNQIKSQEKFFTTDALKQLAEIACKLDTRQNESKFNEEKLTTKSYQNLLKQSRFLIRRIHQENRHNKHLKRLKHRSKLTTQRHMILFARSILNLLEKKKNFVLNQTNHSDCQISTTSDKENISEDKRTTTITTTTTTSSHRLTAEDIVTDLEILLPNGGLVYEGTVQPIDESKDLLLIRLNNERQMYLIPIIDLCRLACRKLIPTNFNMLKENSRVCAYWSTSLRGLHPAVVKVLPSDGDFQSMVNLVFDDGDTGLIKLDEIRLLPDDYLIEGIYLDEWRVSSSQIQPTSGKHERIARHRSSSSSVNNKQRSVKKLKRNARSVATMKIPVWILNLQNSTVFCAERKETLHKGDCIILHGTNQSLSYIGKVLKFYRDRETQQDLVRLQWYYSPEETPNGVIKKDFPGALYESKHVDINPISTIRAKGIIYQSLDEYIKRTNHGNKRKETDFYLVGSYDPVSGDLRRYDNQSKSRSNK